MKRAVYAIPAVGLLWTAGACGSVDNEAACGDGVVNAGEACDDGNTDDTDACSNLCELPACGDGIVQGIEDCDDGNAVDGDSCTNACNEARCGDGVVNDEAGGNETCDDGNAVDGDACTNACLVARCGDGIVNNKAGGREQCDDANAVETDGCLNSCEADPVLRSFLLTKRANAPQDDINTPYTACLAGCYGYGGGVYAQCTVDFNSPVAISMALLTSGSYSRTRTCDNAAGNTTVTRAISGNVSVLTARTKYRITLDEETQPTVILDCDMDANFKLTCLDNAATPRSWELTAQ